MCATVENICVGATLILQSDCKQTQWFIVGASASDEVIENENDGESEIGFGDEASGNESGNVIVGCLHGCGMRHEIKT